MKGNHDDGRGGWGTEFHAKDHLPSACECVKGNLYASRESECEFDMGTEKTKQMEKSYQRQVKLKVV